MTPIISILIPTIERHASMCSELLAHLSAQCPNDGSVEVLVDDTDFVVGIKRNNLLARASGEYVVSIDSDDWVHDQYILLILDALKSRPDCVGINGRMTTNGKDERKWSISKEYAGWYEENRIYYRCTNHLAPVKREIALSVGFPPSAHGEDYAYSMGLRGRLHSEVIIPIPIYHYRYVRVTAPGRRPRPVIKRR